MQYLKLVFGCCNSKKRSSNPYNLMIHNISNLIYEKDSKNESENKDSIKGIVTSTNISSELNNSNY